MTAIYSAFLFKQARGRVFWNSAFVPIHLLVQAMIAGSGVLMIVAVINSWIKHSFLREPQFEFLLFEMLGALIAHAVLIAGELFMPEENVEKMRAIRFIKKGLFSKWFWSGVVGGGIGLPVILLATGVAQFDIFALLTSLLALGGLLLWEHIWVQAGQAVPLS
jgi:formate-dependent nitrite reductase membrane component NrfD